MQKVGIWAAALSMFATLTPALAQDESTAKDSGEQLEAIVVTAQRREESLQKVPIAVTAITANEAQAFGITQSTDIQLSVPGLDMSRQNGSSLPTIRGVGAQDAAPGDENSVAVFVDGVYIASSAANLFALNNIDRVEVLKGPQGTLFGRNSEGGVVNITTKDPGQITTGDFFVGYGNYQTSEVGVYGSTPINGQLATNLAVYFENQNQGWGRNVLLGSDVHEERDISIRNKWLWTPIDDTKIRVSYDYNRTHPSSGIEFNVIPGTIAAYGTRFACFYCTSEGFRSKGVTEQWGVSLNAEQDIHWAKIVSISSYRDVRSDLDFSQFGTMVQLSDLDLLDRYKTYTQEFQLLSPASSAIKWIGGVFYYHDVSGFEPLNVSADLGAVTGGMPNGVIVPLISQTSVQTSESLAEFGQFTIPIWTTTRLTAGLRHTNDKRSIDANADIPGVGTIDYTPNSATFNKFTYRASIDHDLLEDLLVYASASSGFKSGIFNTVSPSSPPVKPESLNAYEVGFKSDLLDRTLRINGAGFDYKFKDQQVLAAPVGSGTTMLINAANSTMKGGELELTAIPVRKLEVIVGLAYLDGHYNNFPGAPFTMQNPTYPYGNVVVIRNAAGYSTVRSPKVTASAGATYTLESYLGDFIVATNYYHNDGFTWDAFGTVRQPSYGILNSSVKWKVANSNVDVSVYGRNLTGAEYYSYAIAQGSAFNFSPAAPRTYGFTVGYHF